MKAFKAYKKGLCVVCQRRKRNIDSTLCSECDISDRIETMSEEEILKRVERFADAAEEIQRHMDR